MANLYKQMQRLKEKAERCLREAETKTASATPRAAHAPKTETSTTKAHEQTTDKTTPPRPEKKQAS